MRITAGLLGLMLLACGRQENSFGQQRGKEFPPGSLRAAQDLPPGRFRNQLDRLPAQARDRAVAWLGNIHFTEGDLPTMHADPSGGIFFADPLEGLGPVAAEEPGLSTASVPISPFPADLIFHSKPGAPNVLYLNFTGETVSNTAWNDQLGRSSIAAVAFSTDADLTTFSEAEKLAIRRIWQRVSEDYAPFDIDVTTERPATFSTRTAHAVITRHTDANGAENPASTAGGVAYVGVFGTSGYAKYRPAWIYQDNLAGQESYIAEAASHEVGHNLGLSHDGKTDGSDYYGGHGSGETSWAPIMGAGYNRNVTQWSKGEYYLANNSQDDLATIAGKLSYRMDDHGNSLGSATPLSVSTDGTIISTTPETDPSGTFQANKGILERNTDVDYFSFATGSGNVDFSVSPWTVPGAITRGGDVDLLLELYNQSGQLLATSNAADATGAAIQAVLTEGVYYLAVKGTGAGNPTSSSPTGYTRYASIGQYFINGSVVSSRVVIPPGADLSVSDISDSGIGAKTFTVTYSDDSAIDVGTIGNDDIRVSGPNGYNALAVLVSVDAPSNGSPRTATYRILPAAGVWTEADNGVYSVSMEANAVQDTSGAGVPPGLLGSFQVAVPRTLYFASMESNPGWTLNGLWQYGAPRYSSGGPVSGFSGGNIVAYNLSGNYENRLAPVYATTPVIDGTGTSTVTLRFQRWLRVKNGDTANIQVSTNGKSWTTLWSNTRAVSDTSWQTVQYTLPAAFTGSATLQIRWGMASGQAQNDIGWNLDDIVLLGNGTVDTKAPAAALNVANLTTGGSPTHTFTVTYTDETAVQVSSFGSTDLIVVGPNGTNTVEFSGLDLDGNGTPRTALYSVDAPNGAWSSADNGVYAVYLQDSEISDTANNVTEPAMLGTFTVAIADRQQSILVSQSHLTVEEGQEAEFTIRLAEQPSANVIVVSRVVGGDPDFVMVSPSTNIFTPQNWSMPAPIRIGALADPDRENGTAIVACESEGLAPVYVNVSEQDTTPITLAPQVTSISFKSGITTIMLNTSIEAPHVLEGSSDFQTWIPLATNVPSAGILTFPSDLSASREFFRVVIPGL